MAGIFVLMCFQRAQELPLSLPMPPPIFCGIVTFLPLMLRVGGESPGETPDFTASSFEVPSDRLTESVADRLAIWPAAATWLGPATSARRSDSIPPASAGVQRLSGALTGMLLLMFILVVSFVVVAVVDLLLLDRVVIS